MKREIKFRAKDFKNKWQFGTYYYGVMYPSSYREHYVDDEMIDDNTLGQYTGLKDKNGVEIYEGDILNYRFLDSDKVICEVFFDNATFKLIFYDDDSTDYLGECNNNSTELEVIGNIYENPELLND